ncbi:MAG: prepilin-type N-terminal cleavage/methylation domain-containing protein [bacterium]
MKTKRTQGFTLVELLIAMVLSGILAIVLYSLFDTTSDSLGEVTNLSDAQDRARFALERVRSDVKAAGSLATPDSDTDVWQRPKMADGRVLGITGYKDWQDDQTLFTAAQLAANPNVSYDGFVIMAALDFPVSFEVRDLRSDADTAGEIAAHTRGLYKLYQVDPFRLTAAAPTSFPGNADFLAGQFGTRLMRLMDRQGYIQFADLDGAVGYNNAPNPQVATFSFNARVPQYKEPTEDYGLDLNPEGDFAYDAALIDAYWYHVEVDPTDETNFRLVRERLCAASVVDELIDPSNFEPGDALGSECPDGIDEKTVIADNVADFQIWFECGSAVAGTIAASNQWTDGWITPDGTGTWRRASSRISSRAHIRLSAALLRAKRSTKFSV